MPSIEDAVELLVLYDGTPSDDLVVNIKRIRYYMSAVQQLSREDVQVAEELTEELDNLQLVLALRAAEYGDQVALDALTSGTASTMGYVFVLYDVLQTSINHIDDGNATAARQLLQIALPGQ